MNFARFFIDRPRFAAVLSILITLVGLISIYTLPISEYPEVAPPSVVVRAQYPGANPRVIAETVATPLEEQINGVENLLYMSSQATADGSLTLTVTFRIGTNPEEAETAVQNRVNRALPRLPDIVRQIGVTTAKASPNLTMVVHLVSPDDRFDALYLRNYAVLNVRDPLLRIPGMGEVIAFGSGDYAMRVWIDPAKLAARGLTSGDVVNAIREQNLQVAAGVIGAPPAPSGNSFQLAVNTQGRLTNEEEFGAIIVRAATADGSVIRLRDVARVEMSAGDYSRRSLLNSREAAAIAIFQAPNSNALQLANDVRATMERLKTDFPQGVDYQIVYDPTRFVETSINKVVQTLLEAVLLVVVVVILFLQTWRASLIPLLAVPVSIVGTFAVLLVLGFSINTLTLFGLVLAIGIVVDDAIVVVENVERNIARGLTPKEATYVAMKEVTGPIIAIALVLCAVFVPLAFVSGLSGQFYRQFAVTIAVSTVISAINSLTLSPALAAVLLQPHGAKTDRVSAVLDRLLGPVFARFNRLFNRGSERYAAGIGGLVRHKGLALGLYAALIGLTVLLFARVPTGFVPTQDKQYLVGFVQLPDGASLDRTEAVVRRFSQMALETPGVAATVALPGLSINGFTTASNAGVIFVSLKPFEERTSKDLSLNALVGTLNGKAMGISDGFIRVFPPPAVQGLGNVGGFKLQLQDKAALGEAALAQATNALLQRAWQTPELAGVFTSLQVNVPQLLADVDRTRAKQLGIDLRDVYDTMQVNLGSLYVNDFNRFGRTYQVIVQAEPSQRATETDIGRLQTRNRSGEMVPLGSIMTVSPTAGPDRVMRYNAFLSADINGGPAPGYSSGQAQAAIEKIAREVLPNGISYEWTELVYQEKIAGNTMLVILPLCVLLVFLVLAATYESWTLPLAIILIVPMCILSAIVGVWASGGDNNIFTQIAFVVLVGLACKNAILIVEFARELEQQGRSVMEAIVEACQLRLRPILMTSIAFIAGVVPLVFGGGAGAEMRSAMGVAVFAGMLGVTVFGLAYSPLFYVLLRRLRERLHGVADSRGAGGQLSLTAVQAPRKDLAP